MPFEASPRLAGGHPLTASSRGCPSVPARLRLLASPFQKGHLSCRISTASLPPTASFRRNLRFKDRISKRGCILSYQVGTPAYKFGGGAVQRITTEWPQLSGCLVYSAEDAPVNFLGQGTWCIRPFVCIPQTNPNHLAHLGEQVRVILVTGFI